MSEYMSFDEKKWPDHYRYVTDIDDRGVSIICRRFVVVGETPCFYYVVSDTYYGYLRCLSDDARNEAIKRNRRRVSKDGSRRYCYPDKVQAMKSFAIRQQRRIGHANLNLSTARLSLAEAERILESGPILWEGDHPCGHDDYTGSFNWGEC